MSTKRSKNTASVGGPTITELLARVLALEEIAVRNNPVLPGTDAEQPKSVDISPFHAEWAKHELLQKLYPPQENGSTTYTLGTDDVLFGCEHAGYYPRQTTNWCGIYVGGCEQTSERRRGLTIPLLVKCKFDFFTPQGLSNSNEDLKLRLDGLNKCSYCLFDFGGDEQCLNYTTGLESLYLFAQGFMNTALIQFPSSITSAVLKFDETEKNMNIVGPWKAVSLRQRRQEYYNIINSMFIV